MIDTLKTVTAGVNVGLGADALINSDNSNLVIQIVLLVTQLIIGLIGKKKGENK